MTTATMSLERAILASLEEVAQRGQMPYLVEDGEQRGLSEPINGAPFPSDFVIGVRERMGDNVPFTRVVRTVCVLADSGKLFMSEEWPPALSYYDIFR